MTNGFGWDLGNLVELENRPAPRLCGFLRRAPEEFFHDGQSALQGLPHRVRVFQANHSRDSLDLFLQSAVQAQRLDDLSCLHETQSIELLYLCNNKSCLSVVFFYTEPMPKKRKPAMTKVVPVKMGEELYDRLQHVAQKVGEADSTIIRLVLRAGLNEIVKDNYELFKFSPDEENGAKNKSSDPVPSNPEERAQNKSELGATVYRSADEELRSSASKHGLNDPPPEPVPLSPAQKKALKGLQKPKH